MVEVIIFGITGLIGRTVMRELEENFSVLGISRSIPKDGSLKSIETLDSFAFEKITTLFETHEPRYVVNCIGLTKHRAESSSDLYLWPNIIFPHYLKLLQNSFRFRLIHISSDCVFSGKKGGYMETDLQDATDHYGATKAISEQDLISNSMVLRTSTVGHENGTAYGLVEWFISQDREVNGFTNAYFNGVTTWELAKVIAEIIKGNLPFNLGISHIVGPKISKFDFLVLLNEIYGLRKAILPYNDFSIDRSLGIKTTNTSLNQDERNWECMLKEMKRKHYETKY